MIWLSWDTGDGRLSKDGRTKSLVVWTELKKLFKSTIADGFLAEIESRYIVWES